MKKSNRMRDITFEIYGRMLNTVSKISLMCTEDLISLNILMILKPLITLAVDEKFEPKLNTFRMIPISVAMTITISKLFQLIKKYDLPNPISLSIISTLNTKANS
jgi:hypothetical protein